MIFSWFAANPAFMGSFKADANLLGGDDALLFINHLFGLRYKA